MSMNKMFIRTRNSPKSIRLLLALASFLSCAISAAGSLKLDLNGYKVDPSGSVVVDLKSYTVFSQLDLGNCYANATATIIDSILNQSRGSNAVWVSSPLAISSVYGVYKKIDFTRDVLDVLERLKNQKGLFGTQKGVCSTSANHLDVGIPCDVWNVLKKNYNFNLYKRDDLESKITNQFGDPGKQGFKYLPDLLKKCRQQLNPYWNNSTFGNGVNVPQYLVDKCIDMVSRLEAGGFTWRNQYTGIKKGDPLKVSNCFKGDLSCNSYQYSRFLDILKGASMDSFLAMIDDFAFRFDPSSTLNSYSCTSVISPLPSTVRGRITKSLQNGIPVYYLFSVDALNSPSAKLEGVMHVVAITGITKYVRGTDPPQYVYQMRNSWGNSGCDPNWDNGITLGAPTTSFKGSYCNSSFPSDFFVEEASLTHAALEFAFIEK